MRSSRAQALDTSKGPGLSLSYPGIAPAYMIAQTVRFCLYLGQDCLPTPSKAVHNDFPPLSSISSFPKSRELRHTILDIPSPKHEVR